MSNICMFYIHNKLGTLCINCISYNTIYKYTVVQPIHIYTVHFHKY